VHGSPTIAGDVLSGCGELPAGVVDQGVDATEALERAVHHRPDLIVFPNVDGQSQRA
jgi:hypothetical protein